MAKKFTQREAEQCVLDNFAGKVVLISTYINRRSNIRLKCLDCSYEWETKLHNINDSRYTSRCPNCTRTGAFVNCAFCGEEIYRSKKDLEKNKSGYFYCSRDCGNRHKNYLREESGEWENTGNYRRVAFNNYEHICAVCKYDKDSRLLQVHHIDNDRNNNSLDNLIILCPTCHWGLTLELYELIKYNDRWILVEK